MHTNYDVLGMAPLSEKILEIKDAEVLDETEERIREIASEDPGEQAE